MEALPFSGGCHCGNLSFAGTLTKTAQSYAPRACDCDYCKMHGAAYISDPEGSLVLTFRQQEQVSRYRQGSGNAEFIVCRSCGVLIGAWYRSNDRIYMAINSKAVTVPDKFGDAMDASPKTLASSEKVQRWTTLWFRDVKIAPVTS